MKRVKEFDNINFLEMIQKYDSNEHPLKELFYNMKKTENGDDAFNTTGNSLLDLFFMTSYFEKHLNEVKISDDFICRLFAMFIRDPRFGIGRRDLGRVLMKQAKVGMQDIVKAGRWDDLFAMSSEKQLVDYVHYIWEEVKKGNELAKKWMPRFNTKDDALAKEFCKILGISQKAYRKAIKANTVEKMMSLHEDESIVYEHVPSLAMLKYYKRFSKDERFISYLERVKQGKSKMNFNTGTVYDIYRKRETVDADLFFEQLPKIELNCIPIVDTSASMIDSNDSIGKAMSLGYYLAKNSTYCKDMVVSFSSHPELIDLNAEPESDFGYYGDRYRFPYEKAKSNFNKGIANIYTGDCSNTNFKAVIELLSKLKEYPEYFVVFSDMEFDRGSSMSVTQTFKMFDEKGIKSKIVWWNLNSRNQTVTVKANEPRCIYMSGYSPELLKHLSYKFDGRAMLAELLKNYYEKISK